MGKKEELKELVSQRRSETHPNYLSISGYDGGFYDDDYFVVPWTAGAQNLDASLMIVGQDWASENFLRKNSKPEVRAARKATGQDARLLTNRNLRQLLEDNFDLSFSETYATDVFVFIKRGDMNGNVPMRDLKDSAKKYAIPQIKIVKPTMVLCLGKRTFCSIRSALGEPSMNWADARRPSGHTVVCGTEVYGVPHTGSWGIKNARGIENVDRIWKDLALHFAALRSRTLAR